MIYEMDFVRYVIQEIHAFMILIRILLTALPILTTFHTPHTRLTRVSHVEMILILVLIVHLNELIKSSVEDLVPIPCESEGIFEDTCDVPFCDNSPPLDVLNDHFELFFDFNDDCTLSDIDSFEDIDYVEASPPDSKLVSLEESPSPFPIFVEDSDSFFEKFDTSLSYSDNSLPKLETFSYHTKETSTGSTTTHVDNSLLEYDLFLFEIKPDQGELTSIVMEDILGEPHVHMPNV
nr:hypothetical protein [Tanacetum cinerariifolium]